MVGETEKVTQDTTPMAEEQVLEAIKGEETSSATLENDNAPGPGLDSSLEEEKNALQDKLLRLAADFENYKKRMIRDRETLFKYAEEGLLKELLPSIDNLERALAHQSAGGEENALREGIDLTLKALLAATAKFGLTAILSVGQPFDPNLHEALAMEESTDFPPQTVLREFEKGYHYKDRLLRAAKVVVTKSS